MKACDRKGKILKKYKREEFRIAIANVEQSSKKLFGSAK